MIIVMRPGAARADIDRVVERVHKAGLTTHLSEGEDRTVIGVIGHDPESYLALEPGFQPTLPAHGETFKLRDLLVPA